jgi:hypothetical protein
LKLLIVCSQPKDPRERPGPFDLEFDSAWADRFIKHLHNERDFCTGCGDRCVHCRDWRVKDFSDGIAGIIRLPSLMPQLLDESSSYLPEKLPPHDVLVAIQIHEEILIDLPQFSSEAGGKAIIAPVEAPEWVSQWARGKLKEKAGQFGLEVAVPKPFCDLGAEGSPVIEEFISYFRIGRPEIEMAKIGGKIAKAEAKISAPCGNSHYVAHSLQGYKADSKLQYEVSHYWHAFPCTASMKQDSELGDTILHRGGQIHMECFCRAAGVEYRPE